MGRLVIGCLLVGLAGGCGSNAEAPVVRQYAVNLEANYHDVVTKLEALEMAVNAFVAAPTDAGLSACKQAWSDARPIYGACEVSRFYNGPIDAAQGGMNEWPIDESFIDYTVGNPMGGIINMPTMFPQINAQVLAASDERGGIENLSTGFHAIEFLLWGQRVDQTSGPGQRPYTDYLDGGTAPNPDRRRTYLQVTASLLLDDMRQLDAAWDLTDPKSYGSMMVNGPSHAGLTNILRGFSNMMISELFYERLDNPYVTQDKKDEESCFSESTIVDLQANALGCQNVYLGVYNSLSGPSVSALVKAKSPALDAQLQSELQAVRDAIAAIPPPFDVAVLSPPTSDANMKVTAAVNAFAPVQATIDQAVALLGVTINL